jgi:hypothetical protein
MRGEGNKGELWGEFKYDILIHSKDYCKRHNVPSCSTTIKKTKNSNV